MSNGNWAAFPNVNGYPGMSLRDYFAAQALPEAISAERDLRSAQLTPGPFRYDKVAKAAYAVADAMLEMREVSSDSPAD